jgi:hypothetical protein
MGAVLRNTGGAIDCLYNTLPETSLRLHQVTEGMTEVVVACASIIEPGPDDHALIYDRTNTHVIAGVARINTTRIAALLEAGTTMSMVLMTAPETGLNPNSPTGY